MLATISALAAVFAVGAPTGSGPVDAVLLATLGAAMVLAGFHAPSLLILGGASACAVAGWDSVALPLALAAGGMVISGIVGESEPLIDAAAAGLVAQAALRLSSPSGRGQTAVIAGVVFVLVLGAAIRTLGPPSRRLCFRTAMAIVGFGVVGGVVAAVAAASSVGPLRRGLSAANAAIDGTQTNDLGATASGLTAAGRDFSRARHSLEAWWAFPARVVPVVAQHWRVLHAAALTGDELADAGQRALSAPALSDVRITDGRVPLEQLAEIRPAVGEAAARASAARRRLDAARSTWLVPPLSEKLDSQLLRVRDIENSTGLANRVLGAMPDLLGQQGLRRYFLAVQTPVEARGGGGFLGNYGEITAQDGRVTLTRFGRQDELTEAAGRAQRTIAGPEDYLSRYQRFAPAQNWVNVNLSPDFPTNAGVIAQLYPQSGGAPIDGVIAVDPAGLAALLAVVGPVEVPSWPVPINSANALQILLFDQYERYTTNDVVQRVDFLGQVAQLAWGRLTGGELPSLPQLMASFGPAVRDKHFFLWSNRADEQRLFEDMHAAGRMASPADDFVALVTQNAGGNKIDYFLRRELQYRVEIAPGSRALRATATVRLHNDAPAGGLGPSLIGNEVIPSLPNGTNKLYLSFYSPWDLVGATVDGAPVALEQARELGRRVYSTAVVIPPKSSATVELTLSGRRAQAGDYRLDILRQPAVSPDDVQAAVVVGGDTTSEREWRLESDATLEVAVGGS
ncbi:MAG TPA: DUF4012 domain-containing protein [Acidimicrobiales bacterium]|nr:DUF4012 domain-containing protein [Acidimicrobiales bacterium]